MHTPPRFKHSNIRHSNLIRPSSFVIRHFLLPLTAVLTMAQTSQPQSQLPDIAAPGATLQRLPQDFLFTEGPASDAQGNIFFTDQPNDTIWKYDTDGKLSIWMKPAGRANGLCFDAQGNLIACADNKNELWSITPDKQITVLVKDFN